MHNDKAEQLLEKAKEFGKQNGLVEGSDPSMNDKLRSSILPALAASRSVQDSLYSWKPRQGGSFTRRLKSSLLSKIKMVVVNVLERFVNKQQKYNELTYQAIVELASENAKLREQISNEK